MKCILVVATVFAIVWLFSTVVPVVGGKFRQLWGRFILVPLGYAGEMMEDSTREEQRSHEARNSHGAHRSHDGHGSHHHDHHHHSSPSAPTSDADDGALRLDNAEVRTEDVSALKESGDRALRRGNLVEAYYWLLRAELAGAKDVESELRKLRAKWIARDCPREYENERSDFTRNQGSFARAVLHLRSGKAYSHACHKIGRLARKGLPEAERFVERYKIRDLGGVSHESSHRHHA